MSLRKTVLMLFFVFVMKETLCALETGFFTYTNSSPKSGSWFTIEYPQGWLIDMDGLIACSQDRSAGISVDISYLNRNIYIEDLIVMLMTNEGENNLISDLDRVIDSDLLIKIGAHSGVQGRYKIDTFYKDVRIYVYGRTIYYVWTYYRIDKIETYKHIMPEILDSIRLPETKTKQEIRQDLMRKADQLLDDL